MLIIVASCVGLLSSCYILLLVTGRAPHCITESDKKITDLSGFDFEITTTYCSGFAKSEHTKIYASKSGERGQTLLFEYDPIYFIELPTISIPEKTRIIIAVARVSSIVTSRDEWRGMKIEYNIGEISYPSTVERPNEKK
jgi:hypothetical protein